MCKDIKTLALRQHTLSFDYQYVKELMQMQSMGKTVKSITDKHL